MLEKAQRVNRKGEAKGLMITSTTGHDIVWSEVETTGMKSMLFQKMESE